MIRLVAFDLDDTLYDESTFVIGGFKAVCRYIADKYNLNENILLDFCLEVLHDQGRGKIFDELCKKFDLREDVSCLVSLYRNNTESLKLFQDAEEILNFLREAGYKITLITDGMASVQRNKLKTLGIESYFDCIVVSDEFGAQYWKPSIYTFKLLLDRFNIEGKEAIYVGDNPNKDFIGARKVGFNTLRIIRKKAVYRDLILDKQYEADYNINSLLEIKAYLKEEI